MSIDYAALTQAAMAGFSDVRCCAMLSRDGLVLGCHPSTDEERAVGAWRRLAMVGDVERGFLVLRDELWAVCRRGPYAAVVLALPSARPGLVLDQLEQLLLTAEEARSRRDGLRAPAEKDAPEIPRGPRSNLHRDTRPPADAPASEPAHDQVASAWARLLQPSATAGSSGPSDGERASMSASDAEADRVVHLADAEQQAGSPLADEIGAGPPGEEVVADGAPATLQPSEEPAPTPPPAGEVVVDRVELSREFAALLQELREENG